MSAAVHAAAAKPPSHAAAAAHKRDERSARTGARIVVIDDDRSVGATIEMLLASRQYAVEVVDTLQAGIEAATGADVDLVITDLRLANGSGFDVIAAVKQAQSSAPVIVMTGFSSVQTAVQSLRFGAVDYIIKPFDNEEFLYAVERALNERRMRRENAALRRNLQHVYAPSAIIGQSPGIKRVLDLIRRVAPTDATVFIQGESGTGKELVAHAIHRESRRSGGPFIAVNCGAIPVDLVESELFGHVKGAFTGAIASSEGLVMEAHGGTLFLDEIGELQPSVQVKLLRAIQEKEVRPVGGKDVRRVDVRFVAASNKDMKQAMVRGEFREDLFYRLNVISIQVPPLRERGGDVDLLVKHFIDYYGRKIGKRIRNLDANFKNFVKTYHWPGNVRELQNLIERAAILTDSDVLNYDDVTDTPLAIASPPPASPPTDAPLSVEDYIQYIVRTYESSRTEKELARMLGIGRKALWVRRRRWAMARTSRATKPKS
ncbi:MAG TPA: sigma-54 dependent transcriptional regulator [Casimicrobiaceae bacterium]|nr:sigma-54 dependent transcriptional regulator [Casimicrobiaceae bacterium]